MSGKFVKKLSFRGYKKFHIAVDDSYLIHAASMTNRHANDLSQVPELLSQIECDAEHVSLDNAYDSNDCYDLLQDKFKSANIVIPPDKNAVLTDESHQLRQNHIKYINEHGRRKWQKDNSYGKRNIVELSIQRRKTLLGNKLHAREHERQKNENMIAAGMYIK